MRIGCMLILFVDDHRELVADLTVLLNWLTGYSRILIQSCIFFSF